MVLNRKYKGVKRWNRWNLEIIPIDSGKDGGQNLNPPSNSKMFLGCSQNSSKFSMFSGEIDDQPWFCSPCSTKPFECFEVSIASGQITILSKPQNAIAAIIVHNYCNSQADLRLYHSRDELSSGHAPKRCKIFQSTTRILVVDGKNEDLYRPFFIFHGMVSFFWQHPSW